MSVSDRTWTDTPEYTREQENQEDPTGAGQGAVAAGERRSPLGANQGSSRGKWSAGRRQ